MTDTTTYASQIVNSGDDMMDHKCTSQIYTPVDFAVALDMLNRLRTMYSNINTQLNVVRNNYSSDIEKIGQRLISEADDRGWCSVYDDVINDLNRELHMELPLRERTFKFQAKYTVYVDVEVEGTDYDDALEEAQEIVEERLNEIEGVDDIDKDWISDQE